MNIDIEKLVAVLRLYKDDLVKMNDPDTIEEERKALCTELTISIDKLINRLNDKRIGVAEGSSSSA